MYLWINNKYPFFWNTKWNFTFILTSVSTKRWLTHFTDFLLVLFKNQYLLVLQLKLIYTFHLSLMKFADMVFTNLFWDYQFKNICMFVSIKYQLKKTWNSKILKIRATGRFVVILTVTTAVQNVRQWNHWVPC